MKNDQGRKTAWGYVIAAFAGYASSVLHILDGRPVAGGVWACFGALMVIAALLTERLR